MNAQDLHKLFVEIRRKIEFEETGAIHSFASAVMPMTPEQELETVTESGLAYEGHDPTPSPALRSLLDETSDFVESPDFSTVLRSCVDKSFSILSSQLHHLFVDGDLPPASPTFPSAQNRISEIPEKKIRLAGILPALARASHTIFNSVPNDYTEALAENRELLEFSAVVYSNYTLE